ncbi:MAG: PLP-dependent aminotransferase family protein [Vallitaleaceae bacterium]|jgi:2-aminoadipate transaminase|nr:PLP-dependent aminotransferase family protein [Vallitaleaceae bacterium]
MQLSIDNNIKKPLYRQIADQIETLIRKGDLPSGYILPPERKLAEVLSVNRTTVLNAYRSLKADGLVISKVGQGTMVDYTDASPMKIKKELMPLYLDHLYATNGRYKMSKFEERLLKYTSDKSLISFAVGILNRNDYPFGENHLIKLSETYGEKLLEHTPFRGIDELIKELINYMKAYNVNTHSTEMLITSGSQQGISLVADIFINPGDVVIVEDPTYFLGKQVFEMKGAKVIGVPMETDGMDMNFLEQILKTTTVKLIYTMPNQHNPTNFNTSTEKKVRLLQLAYEYQAVILEDGAYNDLAFDGNKPITLKSMDYNDQVIYLGTFSKVYSIGIRLGWLIASSEIIERLAYIKHLRDIHTSSISQWLIYDLLARGVIQQGIRDIARINKEKLNQFIHCFDKLQMDQLGITYEIPSGSIYLWMKLPDTIDTEELLQIAMKEGVVFVPGQLFSVGSKEGHNIRINFVYVADTMVEEGLKRLKTAIIKALEMKEGEQATLSLSGFATL